ncbi:MAG: TonB-dependent receptor [Candidatus Kryptoniota bacterium]
MNISKVFAVVLLFSLLSDQLSAQEKVIRAKSAVISGTVKDDAGNPVSYANVFIELSGEGQITDDNGSFLFKVKAVGNVDVIVSAVGYKTFRRRVLVVPGQTYNMNIILKQSPIITENVDITGSSFGSEPGKGLTITSMDVVTTPGGAADIFQSLKTLPGLTQVSESSELYVRGGDPSETLVIIDQASLYNPYTYESPYGGLFSNLNTSAIGEMYFSSGGFSVKYGNALSGVLSLRTKGLPENQAISVGLSLAGASAGLDIPIPNDKLGIRLYARKNFTKPIFLLNGGTDRFSSAPSSQDLNASMIYKYSQTGKVKLLFLASSDNEGVNVDRPEFEGVFTGKSTNYLINLQHTDVIGESFLMQTSISASNYEDKWLLGLLNLKKVDGIRKIRSDIEDGEWSKLKVSFGGEIENRNESFTGAVPSFQYDIRPGSESKLIDEKLSITRFGAYIEIEVRDVASISNFFAIAGLRGDYIDKIKTSWFDPRFTVGYRLGSASTLRFSLGLFHQYQDLRLYSSTDGNPHLLPMKAVHYVLGYDYTPSEGTEFRIETYQKNYTHLPDSNEVYNFDNGGYGYARGVDIIAKGDLPFGLSGWVSYGYIDTKRKWLYSNGLAPSSFDVTHNFTLVWRYNITDAWQIGMNFKYATGRPYTPVTGSVYHPEMKVYEPVYGTPYSARYPDYRRLDIRLTYLARLFDKYFTVLYVEGLNVLNIHNVFDYAYSPDYSSKTGIRSYFGQRTIVIGILITI